MQQSTYSLLFLNATTSHQALAIFLFAVKKPKKPTQKKVIKGAGKTTNSNKRNEDIVKAPNRQKKLVHLIFSHRRTPNCVFIGDVCLWESL